MCHENSAMTTANSIDTSLPKRQVDLFKRAPHTEPPFTLSELKKAIPPHCFKRSLLHSSVYFLYDLAAIFTLYRVATTIIPLLPTPLRYAAWPVYWVAQGALMTGISSQCHMAGHHTFSDYRWLDTAIGFMFHSLLLIPALALKHTHNNLHHTRVGSLEREEAIGSTGLKDQQTKVERWFFNLVGKHPIRVVLAVLMLITGVYLYLGLNIFGRRYGRFASHYYPWSPLFGKRQRLQVIVSDICVLAALYMYYQIGVANGWTWFACVIGGSFVFLNVFETAIVYLNHIHPSLPRYDVTEWSWLRGALSTIDRDWGILNHVFHHANSGHVVHHLFSSIPHYHAMEATRAIKPILGEYYQYDDMPFYKAFYREMRCVAYLEKRKNVSDKGVYWFAISE